MKSVFFPVPAQIQTADLSAWKRRGGLFARDPLLVDTAAWVVRRYKDSHPFEWGAFPFDAAVRSLLRVPDTKEYERQEHAKYLQGLLDWRQQSDSAATQVLRSWFDGWLSDSLQARIERERRTIPAREQRRDRIVQYVSGILQSIIERKCAFKDVGDRIYLTEEFIWDCYNASIRSAS